MTKDTGGAAFPDFIKDGMSLRDYFAAKAMQEFVGVCDYKEGAIRAYKWADAMLKERKQ